MTNAKQCDLCKALYETKADHNYVNFIDRRSSHSVDLQAQVKVKRHDLFDHKEEQNRQQLEICKDCAKMGVQQLMHHLGIKECRGSDLTCYITKGRGQMIYFDAYAPGTVMEQDSEKRAANAEFFAQFAGKRVRITVEVL